MKIIFFLPSKQMAIGSEASSLLQQMPMTERKGMLDKVKKSFSATGVYMKSKLPIDNKLIIAPSSLDPIARKHSTTKNMIRQLNQLIHLPETDDFLH
ncbi:hypothetical protein ElyMa_005900500 [Elysia marginata]|uniref:Uncharacterized protein n=1 Tax=Elysia marginata TaxID=1093978 RepID=A0AAV4G541_9GAST|nr:hypothetical protein ElyMa_005900500 [Elysia marginata]